MERDSEIVRQRETARENQRISTRIDVEVLNSFDHIRDSVRQRKTARDNYLIYMEKRVDFF